MKIHLASQSPRRKQLLIDSGFEIEVVKADVEETFPPHLEAGNISKYLAEKKADAYKGTLKDELLVTADTIVWTDERVLNKPDDFDAAFSMIKSLSGRMHHVFTGVCIKSASQSVSFYESTEVYFRTLKDEDIRYYIETYMPYDKAGAYGIQEWIGYRGVEKINGCFYNVMGFPVSRFCVELDVFIK